MIRVNNTKFSINLEEDLLNLVRLVCSSAKKKYPSTAALPVSPFVKFNGTITKIDDTVKLYNRRFLNFFVNFYIVYGSAQTQSRVL